MGGCTDVATSSLLPSVSDRETDHRGGHHDHHAAQHRHRRRRHRPEGASTAAMWALGDYHAVATEIIPDLGPGARRGRTTSGPGEHVLDVAAGSGNVAIPAAADRRARDRQRPHARAARPGPRRRRGRRGAASSGRSPTPSTCPSTTTASTPSPRASASCSRRTTSRPPTSWSGSAVRAGRIGLIAWTPDRVHRAAVRHHEAVRRTAAARSPAPAAVGRPRARPRAARRPGHRPPGQPAAAAAPTGSPTRWRSATTSRPTTARRSRRTAVWRTTPRAPPSSTRPWSTSVERFRTPDGGIGWEYLLVVATEA